MVFEWKDEGKFHRVPKLTPGPPNVYFGDIFSTASSDAPNPLTSSLFLLEKVENPEPAPTYTYDESGIVVKGELHVEDEKGNSAKLLPGDTFFIHRGSTILFSTPRYAVAYKVAARRHAH
ncbi:ethanolamine utilization protein (EutQ) [Cordyceps javanica]|uniref:Ethanolamine utilization protein (EutQ) n=1 Tax=Cordyceps javanica TaxID=43265 RepID=A0A545VUW3_9HYPO|nr:ethanolamine utilization protein (EutQ) [Cordyceps javanica]TQW05517.1 ethanolamine utilization protein (EutQ) [Cordyceps javanica]